ncbi:MAG TPA: MFS transporter [Candidatus Rubrimentiphilum sp.]|nr:MFS transporter [Candidatus Rubrimentiphilum sp.]
MRPNTPNPALLGAFWFGIQMVWGALLGISLQTRAAQLAPQHELAAYALLAGAGAAMAGISQIVTGIVSDRRRVRGSRRIEFYVAGAITGSAAVIWFYVAPSYVQLIAALLLLQLGLNVAIGPYQAAIPDFVEPKALGSASAWMAALQSLGNIAGALVASFVKSAVNTGAAIASTLLLTCAVTSAHVRTLEVLPTTPDRVRITRAFADLFISRALVYVGFYTLLGYLLFYVRQMMQGDAQTNTGMLLITFLIAAAIGAALAARPVNRFDRRNVATMGGAVFIAGLIVFLIAHASAEVIAAALVAGFAWGIFLTADWALGCAFLPRNALATAMGVWNLALLIPQILAPALVTATLSALHALQNPDAPRIAFVLACLEVAAGLAWLRRLPASRAGAA